MSVAELDEVVAVHAGIRCAARLVVGAEVGDDVRLEVLLEVEHGMLDAEPVGARGGVLDAPGAAAGGVGDSRW